MKRILFFIPIVFAFYSCNKLTADKAKELINQRYQYPMPVELNFTADYVVPQMGDMGALAVFPGKQLTDQELKLVTGFADKGLIKLNDKVMSGNDAKNGNPITWHHYTAKLTTEWKKYTSYDETEVNSGLEIYKVRLYSQQLGEITSIVEKDPGKTYEVHFTTIRATPTPYYDVYKTIYPTTGLFDITKVEQGTETFVKTDDGEWKIE